jgi:branched-chain amino acid transport system substrate-binding protein
MWRPLLYVLLILLGLFGYAYWEPLYHAYWRPVDPTAQTVYRLGIVYPADGGEIDLLHGAQIAVDELNAQGGLLGRKVEITPVEEKPPPDLDRVRAVVEQALPIARQLSRDPALIAVIGHSTSSAAVTASPVYDQAKKLYFAPYATNVSLVEHKLQTVFSMVPNDAMLAYVLAHYSAKQGYKKLAILTNDSEYGQETGWFFAIHAEQLGMEITYRNAFRPLRRSMEDILTFMLDNTTFSMKDIDAIAVIAEPRDTGHFINLARRLGITVPIMGTDTIGDLLVRQIAGDGMKDVVGVTVINPAMVTPDGAAFGKTFLSRHGRLPTLWGVLGHDAVVLTTEAARRTGSVHAGALSDVLRIMRFEKPIVGANGAYGFTRNGEVIGQPAFVIRHDGKEFQYVDRYDSLPRFSDNDYFPNAARARRHPIPAKQPGAQ